VKNDIKSEWEGLRRHDVVFLITVRPPVRNNDQSGTYDFDKDFVSQVSWLMTKPCHHNFTYIMITIPASKIIDRQNVDRPKRRHVL
jgi:hypothetical protein